MIMKSRIEKEVVQCENFEKREGLTGAYVLQGIYQHYRRKGLHKIARWRTGSVPYMYLDAKDKDLNKSRLVTSYSDHPLKYLYRIASKAGTWLLRQLPKSMRHWTLHKISDIPKRVRNGMKWLKRKYGKNTRLLYMQSDVKQMYTNL